jgi:thermitase
MNRIALIACALCCTAGIASAQIQSGPPAFVEVADSMEFSGRVIVRPLQAGNLAQRGMNGQQIAATRRAQQAELAQYRSHSYEALVDHHVLFVPAGMNENQFVNQLMGTGLFEFAEPDWTLYPIGCPDDSLFGNQWHHDASKMQSCDAWGIDTGNPSVTVGICDTGVETTHPDLQLNRKEGYNAVDRVWENQGGNIGPVHWHGTGTTGCAAANGDNGIGVSGTGWNLGHRMMRVSNSSNGSAALSTLTHAALTSIQAGDRVANVSYSGVTSSSVRSTATQIKNLGGLLTWSAGNNGANLNWGNRDNDDVIVVGATTSFSAYGASVDLMAPGSGVVTTYTGSNYASVSGTSFSAPLTAGLIALIWSADPSLTPDQVEGILKSGCDDLGSSGVDNTYGYGRINSYNSLLLIGGGGNTPPTVTISSPADNSTFTEGDSVVFTGSATDAEDNDGDLTASITWTSNLDNWIGDGASFATSGLSIGTHVVTASVTDSGSATDTDTVTVVIDPPAGSAPAAPDGVSATNLTNRRARVDWNDNSDNETSFEIQREKWNRKHGWRSTTTITGIGANSTSYTDRPGTGLYQYRVRASNASGDSDWSAWAEVTVTRR